MKKILSISAVILSVIILFCSCNTNSQTNTTTQETPQSQNIFTLSEIGEGEKSFVLEVQTEDGETHSINVKTNKNTVGEALSEYSIIDGEQGAYGLYIKYVNGIFADYAVNGAYWAFYINGELASQGADLTEINENDVYLFKFEKA